jgi:N-acetylglucosamine-6-phosphate deacetylase
LAIINAGIVTPHETVHNGALEIKDGVIRAIGDSGDPYFHSGAIETVVDAEGDWLVPGFIDIHVHGGNGDDFVEADPEGMRRIARFHAGHGTTGLLVTTYSVAYEQLEQTLELAYRMLDSQELHARVLGVHMEGPFLNPAWAGAQNPRYIVPPRLDWMRDWTARYPGLVRMMTLAPEMPGSLELIRWLREHAIVCACGHTGASYDRLMEAIDAGLSHAVHTYNAMLGLHHRQPGALGAVLTNPDVSAEIIADGQHVHPACIKLLLQSKPADKVILITDAIAAAGYPDGEFVVGGLDVVVAGGIARVKGTNTLAGSTLTMSKAFQYAVRTVGIPIEQASRMASGNPARLLGLDGEIGSIAVGMRADLVRLDAQLNVRQVFIRGQVLR